MAETLLFVGWEITPLDIEPPEGSKPEFKDKGGQNPRTAAEQEAEWLAEFHKSPYGGRLSRAVIMDPQKAIAQEFKDGKAIFRPSKFPKGETVPVALQVAGWLEKHYAKSLPGTLVEAFGDSRGRDTLSFLGFEPRRFIKHLGIECARLKYPARAGLWYANSDHRDMGGAIMPEPFHKQLELAQVLELHGIGRPDWSPGNNAEADAVMALRIALHLGLVTKAEGLATAAEKTLDAKESEG